MSASILVDTNVLLYMLDEPELAKRPKAIEAMARLGDAGTGVVTTQILGEFASGAMRKVRPALSAADTLDRLDDLVRAFRVLAVTPQTIMLAVMAVERWGFSYWDAQVWASASMSDIDVVLTEDLPGVSELDGVRFVNPLAEDFSPVDVGL